MKMTEFVLALNEKLSNLPSEEVEERLDFYCEMISDRIEDGMPEEEAVAKMGTVDEVAEQIIIDIPLSSIVKKKIKSRRKMSATEITLLALGSPIWLSILISLFSVFISLYAAVWSVVISLWACFVSFVAFALLGVVLGGALIFTKNVCVFGMRNFPSWNFCIHVFRLHSGDKRSYIPYEKIHLLCEKAFCKKGEKECLKCQL